MPRVAGYRLREILTDRWLMGELLNCYVRNRHTPQPAYETRDRPDGNGWDFIATGRDECDMCHIDMGPSVDPPVIEFRR